MIAKYVDTLIPLFLRKKFFSGYPMQKYEDIQYIELQNCFIRYLVRGSGKTTILLAPDPPITIELYEKIINRLSKKYRVVIFEMPGFGFSPPKINWDFSYESLNHSIVTLIKKLNLESVVLALPCVSGFCAIGIANSYPEIVKGVILTQTPCWDGIQKWTNLMDKSGILTTPILGQIMLQYIKKKRISVSFNKISNKNIPNLISVTDKAMKNNACFSFSSATQYMINKKKPEVINTLKQPGLIMWGTADSSHLRIDTDFNSTKQFLPNATSFHLKEAGHFIEVEESNLYCDYVSSYMEKHFY